MMTVHFICNHCGSDIKVSPSMETQRIDCLICSNTQRVHFDLQHEYGLLKRCPKCLGQKFYAQKDLNRKLAGILFALAAITSAIMLWRGLNPLWYVSIFVLLYFLDYLLFRRQNTIAICYNCHSVFHNVRNIVEIPGYGKRKQRRLLHSS